MVYFLLAASHNYNRMTPQIFVRSSELVSSESRRPRGRRAAGGTIPYMRHHDKLVLRGKQCNLSLQLIIERAPTSSTYRTSNCMTDYDYTVHTLAANVSGVLAGSANETPFPSPTNDSHAITTNGSVTMALLEVGQITGNGRNTNIFSCTSSLAGFRNKANQRI